MKVVFKKMLKRVLASGLAPLMLGTNVFALKRDLPIENSNVEIHSTQLEGSTIDIFNLEESSFKYRVSDIPSFYKNQIVEAGIDANTTLSSITSLTLDIDDEHDLTWIGYCDQLTSLSINFLKKVEPEKLYFSNTLENLKTLKVSCLTTETFESSKTWQKDQETHKNGPFIMIFESGYDTATKKYYSKNINDVQLSWEMIALLDRCPNVEELTLNAFAYNETTDLSWISNARNLKSLTIDPYFDNFWDLTKEIPEVLSNLTQLSKLKIRTNSCLMSDSDYELIKETLSHLDIEFVDFSGLTLNCFSFKKEGGIKTLYIGTGDTVDFYDLERIDKIDFSRSGINYATVYLDSLSMAYLLSQNIEIGLGEKYDLNSLKNINSRLDQIIASLNIYDASSDREKLDRILDYIFKKYTYADLKVEKDIYARFYTDGPLYGALKSDNIVCGNYASLLCALLHRVGIESYYVWNKNHAWNLIKIDSRYYYIDPTCLDTSYDLWSKRNLSKETKFKKLHDLPMYLRDPNELEDDVIKDKQDGLYVGGTKPYWILNESCKRKDQEIRFSQKK